MVSLCPRTCGVSPAQLTASYRGQDPILPQDSVTVMMQNIPKCYSVDAVWAELSSCCDVECIRLIHLPWDSNRSANISFAFISFSEAEAAQRCFFAMSGRNWMLRHKQKKPCSIVSASVQGVSENLEKYIDSLKDARLLRPPYAPLAFWKGERLDIMEAVQMYCDDAVKSNMLQTLASIAGGELGGTRFKVNEARDVDVGGAGSCRNPCDFDHRFRGSYMLDGRTCSADTHSQIVQFAAVGSDAFDPRKYSQEDVDHRSTCLTSPSNPPWPLRLVSPHVRAMHFCL